MPRKNRANERRGSSFDAFLQDQGMRDEVQAIALKRAIAEAIQEAMDDARISKVEMARRMGTSRSQLDRVLDPTYAAVQLDTLINAASALRRELRLTLTKRLRA